MKNYEKYADEIREYRGVNFCDDFVIPHILKKECSGMNCSACRMLQRIWLLEEYEESEVDWSKVEVDTPILVKHDEAEEWARRYFAKNENGKVYAWSNGCTSWTVYDNTEVTDWEYAKLAEQEGSNEELREIR